MKIIVLLVLLINCINCARILVILPFSARSHHFVFSSLTEALSKRNHEMVVVSSYPLKEKRNNYTDINIWEDLKELHHTLVHNDLYQWNSLNLFYTIPILNNCGLRQTEAVINSKKLQQLMNDKIGFDLVIAEGFLNEALYGFAEYFQAPLINMSPFGGFHWLNYVHSNPIPFSYIPNGMLPFTDEMTLYERFFNALFTIVWDINNNYYFLPQQEKLRQKLFGKGGKNVWELSNSVSLTLLNNHFSIHYPRPLVPSIIEVGGMHVFATKNKPLPNDIKSFLDDAKQGAIYFSMGSNLQSYLMDPEKIKAILETFKVLKKYHVIWKWELDNLEGKPNNVMIKKWLPQQDILAHPNIKLFITHGGLLSTQEAAYYGVPIVGIPVFGDQDLNMFRSERAGVGIKLDLKNVTKTSLLWSINSVLNNPKYLLEAKRRAIVYRDQPETPMERAIFWVEYIIRHKGAHHLKSGATKLSFYQIYMLDILLIILISLITFIGIIYLIVKKCCYYKPTNNKKKQQ